MQETSPKEDAYVQQHSTQYSAIDNSSDIFWREPPKDSEAEMNVLGSILISPASVPQIRQVLKPRDFADSENRIIFEAIGKMDDDGIPVDALLLKKRMKDEGILEEAGGSLRVGQLINAVTTASNVMHYADIVRQKSRQRDAISAAEEILSSAYAYNEPEAFATAIQDGVGELTRIAVESGAKKRGVTLRDVLGAYAEGFLNGKPRPRFDVGEQFSDLGPNRDSIVIGPRTLTAFGAESGGGKSALVFWLMWEALRNNDGLKVAVCSTEMGPEDILDRLVSNYCGIKYGAIIDGRQTDEEKERFKYEALNELEKIQDRVFFHRSPHQIDDFLFRAKAFGAKLLIVDYLQAVTPPATVRDTATSKMVIDSIVAACRSHTLDEEAGVVLVSQINRQNYDKNSDKEGGPTMAAFKESGNIENSVDFAYLITTTPETREESERDATLHCVKAKYGSRWKQAFRFLASYQQFRVSHAPVRHTNKDSFRPAAGTTTGSHFDPDAWGDGGDW